MSLVSSPGLLGGGGRETTPTSQQASSVPNPSQQATPGATELVPTTSACGATNLSVNSERRSENARGNKDQKKEVEKARLGQALKRWK